MYHPMKTLCYLPPFSHHASINLLGAYDHVAQCKALVAPFKKEFDGKSEDILQHVADFNQCCKDTGIVEDFNFIEEEDLPPSDVDMTDSKACTAWLSDPHCFTYGNIILDSSKATIEKLQSVCDSIHTNLGKFTSQPDPVKMPEASKKLVSFQNRQWVYVLLQNVWTITMKSIMSRVQE
jgi:hypothetical protein